MSKPKILFNHLIEHAVEAKEILEEIGGVDYCAHQYDELKQVIGQYDALIPSLDVMIDEGMLSKAGRLKIIATPSTGTDHIDLGAAEKLGITVVSLKNDYDFLKNVTATAELAFALMLSIMRNIPFAFDSVRQAGWNNERFRGNEVLDKTLGIIGYGRLGEMISRYARGFRMKVIACDPYKTITDDWVEQVELDELLKRADMISVHVHLNTETRSMIGRHEFSLMKPSAFLINTSRGAVIDQDALLEALETGKIKAAAVDVITDELRRDFENHPMIKYAATHENLIITPHMGGATFESQDKAFKYTAAKVRRYFTQHPKEK